MTTNNFNFFLLYVFPTSLDFRKSVITKNLTNIEFPSIGAIKSYTNEPQKQIINYNEFRIHSIKLSKKGNLPPRKTKECYLEHNIVHFTYTL